MIVIKMDSGHPFNTGAITDELPGLLIITMTIV